MNGRLPAMPFPLSRRPACRTAVSRLPSRAKPRIEPAAEPTEKGKSKNGSDVEKNTPTAAINSAPANEAAVPRSVTAPEVPASTGRKLGQTRGGHGLKEPISDAHVSAFAAATATTNRSSQIGSGRTAANSANTAGTPPLASTWMASRRPPFANFSDSFALRCFPMWLKKLELTKNAA